MPSATLSGEPIPFEVVAGDSHSDGVFDLVTVTRRGRSEPAGRAG